MNLEEARKVLWLKNNPRPMGELLDDGYLTQGKLEWAAQKAYDSAIKQAAQVILDGGKPKEKELAKQLEPTFEIPISLEKARAILWPFPPYKSQPLGTLIESNKLSLKDLGYAIENAWDENVRKAAIALLLVRLDQIVKEPVPSAGFVREIAGGRSYSARRQSQLTLLEGMILGFLLGIGLILTIVFFINPFGSHPNAKPVTELISTPAGLIALFIIAGLVILSLWLSNFILDQVMKRLDKEIEEHQRGEAGEDKTIQLIVQVLDGNWGLFRNIRLPGRNRGDLDIVLVGPPGVWVLEVKNLRGEYRNIGEGWEYRRGKKWKKAFINPSRQALNNAARLGNFLKADHINIFANPVVVWANEENSLFLENPSIAVWLHNRLPDELGNIWQGEKLSEEKRKKIINKLSSLCEK